MIPLHNISLQVKYNAAQLLKNDYVLKFYRNIVMDVLSLFKSLISKNENFIMIIIRLYIIGSEI